MPIEYCGAQLTSCAQLYVGVTYGSRRKDREVLSRARCFFVKISMADPAADDDPHISPNVFQGLPAAYGQQVMSPSGVAAQGHAERAEQQPNGVVRTGTGGRSPDYDDDNAFRQALESTGLGARTATTGHGTAMAETGSGATIRQRSREEPRVESGSLQQELGSARRDDIAEPERPAVSIPMLPGATATAMLPSGNNNSLWPSPIPSPMTRASPNGELTHQAGGRSANNPGAAAVRWFSRIGEFVQRHAAMVSQGRPGIEAAVVQETVWSPTRTRQSTTSDPPLFDRSQSRRLQELASQAPLLYGQVAPVQARSDSSESYSREQLEAEVRKQVEKAMTEQRTLTEENQRLRLQVERLSSEVAAGRESDRQLSVFGKTAAATGSSGFAEASSTNVVVRGAPVGNPPGLSGHDRVSRGQQGNPVSDNVPGGNPPGLPGHGAEQGGDGLGQFGVLERQSCWTFWT